MGYQADAICEVGHFQAALNNLDDIDLEIWGGQPAQWATDIVCRVHVNDAFLKLLPNPQVCGADLGPNAYATTITVPERHRVASRNATKVRSTLRQFVRDWAKEGAVERSSCYEPIIGALLQHMPPRAGGPGQRLWVVQPKVLIPGCGLARLPFDLASLGYAAQGNEFSYHMLLGSHFLLNRCQEAESHVLFPYLLSTSSRKCSKDHLRAVRIPDVCPPDIPPGASLSMSAGEFVETYKDQCGEWDAMATCFFLDTAKNIFLYVRTIAQLVRPGGLWVNLGPLLYHYAENLYDISVEPSWEELRPFICRYFDLVEESNRQAYYTRNVESLQCVSYRCIFFVGRRNDIDVTGKSNPVF